MRDLTRDEIDEVLDDNGESDDCVAIEATISEFISRGVSTCCGTKNNNCFANMNDFADRRCRGWYDPKTKEVVGMFHIECSKDEAELITNMAYQFGGSLLTMGSSRWNGFWEFEIE